MTKKLTPSDAFYSCNHYDGSGDSFDDYYLVDNFYYPHWADRYADPEDVAFYSLDVNLYRCDDCGTAWASDSCGIASSIIGIWFASDDIDALYGLYRRAAKQAKDYYKIAKDTPRTGRDALGDSFKVSRGIYFTLSSLWSQMKQDIKNRIVKEFIDNPNLAKKHESLAKHFGVL